MSLDLRLQQDSPPIVAILRGVRPDEVVEIGLALLDAGIRMIEVPLNSPQPLVSIERLVGVAAEHALIGAGTVLTTADVDAVSAAGGRLMVAPNTNPAVIARALEKGMDVLPGVMTPTEAFAAIAAGARHIKLFPGSTLGPAYLRALRDVLPRDCRVWAVGGTSVSNLREWLDAGATGIGIGGSLYQPGIGIDDLQARATALVTAWRSIAAKSHE